MSQKYLKSGKNEQKLQLVDGSVWDGMWEETVAFFSLNAGLTEHCQVQGLVHTLCDMYVMSHGQSITNNERSWDIEISQQLYCFP